MSENVAGVLDALEQAIEQARSMPMSSSVLVNRAEVLELVNQLRSALPTELADAGQVLAGADKVVATSREEAERILADARRRAAELIAREKVVTAAHARAAEIVADAEHNADVMRREADDYCDRRLADFEIDLGRVLAQVQSGRAKLAGRMGEQT
jgi:cell division septum initiation protein DivIVA